MHKFSLCMLWHLSLEMQAKLTESDLVVLTRDIYGNDCVRA
jgi:hypothetical protein